ncbi:MAG: PGF-CTERM sorting domain-containing protein [Halobacteriota archaeon]|nr:PGF-CTERM sorting domain-containing protein [Halobacteriota archaeon]
MQISRAVIGVILLICAISTIVPVHAIPFVDKAVICADKPAGYEDYTAHYRFHSYSSEPHFPPGSTVYIYVEATGKTKEDTKTGQFKPNIKFEMEGERSRTGGTFSASTSSDKRINDDVTPYKKTYGIISYKIDKDAIQDTYRFKIIAKDKNDGNKIVARGPYMRFIVEKNSSLYAPYKYTYNDLNITPNPAELGTAVTISVNVTNIGGKSDLKGMDVKLFYDGKNITNNLHLADDETKRIEFKLSEDELDEVGTHNIKIGDQKKTLIVEETEVIPTSSSPAETPGGGRRGATPGFEGGFAIAGLLAVAYVLSKSNKRRR